MRDGTFNYVYILINGVLGLVVIPFMLIMLGRESYGVLVVVLSFANTALTLNFGLCWSINRHVAASHGSREHPDAFVGSAATISFLMGLAGAVVITLLAIPTARVLHLTPAVRASVPLVFFFGGLSSATSIVADFIASVFKGLRRFKENNMVILFTGMVRSTGTIALLLLGARVREIALWYAIAGGIGVATSLMVMGRVEPGYKLRLGAIRWSALRPHFLFGLASQGTRTVNALATQTLPILFLGAVNGASVAALYQVGQRLPLAGSEISGRMSEVVFTAASEQARQHRRAAVGEILAVGTRWTAAVMLPIALLLFIFAPSILHAWVGIADPAVVLVMRFITVAVFVQAMGETSSNVLFGMGNATTVLAIYAVAGVLGLLLALALAYSFGMAGVAAGMIANAACLTLLAVPFAASRCHIRVSQLSLSTVSGLVIPGAGCLACAAALSWYVHPQRWLTLITAGSLSAMCYLLLFFTCGAREEERLFLRKALGFLFRGWPRTEGASTSS